MKVLATLFSFSLCALSLKAADAPPMDDVLAKALTYRNVGPFRAGSWVPAIAVPETPAKAHLYTLYVAARNGGVWKTTNNGTTFQPLFDKQDVLSIGAVAVAPSDERIVWVGTGDASCTRSAYRGDGIYKSTDGGKTWEKMGLADSQHIARIIIHPSNPDVVYVAAMGHLFSTNEERGVFKTTDGGKTWKKVLYVNEKTGVIDLVLNRRDPETLYAATYECERFPWILADGGSGSGVYKTTDGGANWKKLENGLPTGTIGRIGLDLFQKNPDILYAMLDNQNHRETPRAETGTNGGRGALPNIIGGEMYRSDDAGATWRKMNSTRDDLSRKSGYAFNQVRVDPGNPDRIFITGSTMAFSPDGGKTWEGLNEGTGNWVFRKAFGDFRTLWIDPENPERMIAGSDGGVFLSYDGGRTSDHLANLPLGEIYALTMDMETPFNIYAGLQDHDSWKGPSEGWSGSVGMEDWSTVGIGDGMYNQVDPSDSRWVYNTQEFGRVGRMDQKTRERKIVAPTRPSGQPNLRFNWVAPIRLSPHDPKTIYAGAQVLFRSKDRGEHWEEISPDLTGNDQTKISPPGATIQFCTITTISESPARAGVIWVGTDDGKVQVTRDSGKSWTDVTREVFKAGGPEDAWVTRVCASPSQPGTAYVAKSRHREDDFRPFLFKTTDYGATWTAITENLPERPINVVCEDWTNSNLLFVGNDNGIYVSLNGGGHWATLKGNMPPVPVQDLAVHARDGVLAAGTFGRGIWLADITPLREMNEETLNQEAHFFAVQPAGWRHEGSVGNYQLYSDRHITTPNGPNGPVFNYYLKESPGGPVTFTITDAKGETVRTLDGTKNAGLNRVVWSSRPQRFGGRRGGAGVPPPRDVPAGEYTVTLKVGDKTYVQKTRLLSGQVSNADASENDGDDVQ